MKWTNPENGVVLHTHTWIREMWNRMFITHREIPKHEKLTTSKFRDETFYYLWVKRFFDIRSEIQCFYADFSICPRLHHHHTRHLPQGHRPGFGKPRKSTVFSRGRTQLWLFSNLSPRLRCVTSLSSQVTSSIWDFYCDISKWYVRTARAWTTALMFAPN